MTGLLLCTCSEACQADSTCHRPPRFQAFLEATRQPQPARVRRRTEACACHLGAMVAAMTAWAREQHLTEGDLTILTIDPPPYASHPGQQPCSRGGRRSGLVFSIIQLGVDEDMPTPVRTAPPGSVAATPSLVPLPFSVP